MERIVIEVSEETAKKWRIASQKRKAEISERINSQLAIELSEESKEEFKQFLSEIRQTMKDRGLTEEKLQEILKDDE